MNSTLDQVFTNGMDEEASRIINSNSFLNESDIKNSFVLFIFIIFFDTFHIIFYVLLCVLQVHSSICSYRQDLN